MNFMGDKLFKSLKYSFLLLLILNSCVSSKNISEASRVRLMTYNVENLFDNLDDPNKEDETYLSLKSKNSQAHKTKCNKIKIPHYKKECLNLDWSDQKIEIKLKRLADVILQNNDGVGPDILILAEVENINILERLRTGFLQNANYKKAILIEGPDERGIDVAILSRLELNSPPQLNSIDLSNLDKKYKNKKSSKKSRSLKNKKNNKKNFDLIGNRPTRGILQAQFILPNKELLTVFACHFPSQGSPTSFRLRAIETLNKLKSLLPSSEYVIAAGDFNITKEEDLKENLITKSLGDEWLISHKLGCKDCKGTHNYRGHWSFLDLILFSKNFDEGLWHIDSKSIEVGQKSQYQLKGDTPARFEDGRLSVGVSDHLPLIAEIYSIKK
jgi:endonuclease/exonuclease/phosphatase family metal-dependent hydrolase